MPTYTIETPRGHQVTIQADSPDVALSGAQKWDLEDYASSEAQRVGVSPDLVLRQMDRESGGNPSAVSPKGARGPMQLMPGTAKDLGVDPNDPYQNITGGVTYLKRQLDAFGGDESKALAAYNAGPAAVRKAGGVPNFPETRAYVAALAGKGAPAPPAPILARAAVAAPVAQRGPTIAQDALAGLLQPLQTLGHDVMQNYRGKVAQAQGPLPSPMDALRRTGSDIGQTARMLGDVLGLASAPVQAVVKPAARAIVANGPTPYSAPKLTMQNGRLAVAGPQALQGEPAQAAVENLINTALSGARAAAPRAPTAPVAPPMTLDEIRAANAAAWKAVENSTHPIAQADAKAAANAFTTALEDAGGADLYADAPKYAKRLSSLADKGDLTVGQVNKLRSQAGNAMLAPGSKETDMGGLFRDALDGLILNSGDPSVAPARELYTRLKKVEEVTNRTDSAELRAASTYAGGNQANATRQNLRPLIDPKSPQRIRNLTPDETKALNDVVRGTPSQNAMRTAGKLLDPRGLLGSTFNLILGAATGGHAPLITAPAGAIASSASNKMTAGAVRELLDLMSSGGMRPTPAPPVNPFLALAGRPAVPMLSGPGLVGVNALAQQPARLLAAPSARPRTKKERAH